MASTVLLAAEDCAARRHGRVAPEQTPRAADSIAVAEGSHGWQQHEHGGIGERSSAIRFTEAPRNDSFWKNTIDAHAARVSEEPPSSYADASGETHILFELRVDDLAGLAWSESTKAGADAEVLIDCGIAQSAPYSAPA